MKLSLTEIENMLTMSSMVRMSKYTIRCGNIQNLEMAQWRYTGDPKLDHIRGFAVSKRVFTNSIDGIQGKMTVLFIKNGKVIGRIK